MKTLTSLPLLGITLYLGGCSLPSVKALPAGDRPVDVAAQMPATTSSPMAPRSASEPRLYARDGSIVNAQSPGTVAMTPSTGQSAAVDDGSRWTLLEQYQATIQENESLEFELEALTRALEQSEARETGLATEITGLEAKIAGLGQRVEVLEGHNLELASRLTTAQIRRLQSEKLLLEAKLDWKRVEAVINASQPTATDPAPAGEPLEAGTTGQTLMEQP